MIDRSRRSPQQVFIVILVVLFSLSLSSPSAFGNPFETIGADHWALRAVRQLTNAGLLNARADIRFQLGSSITLFDLAFWVGEALERMGGALPDEGRGSPLSEWVAAYNEAHPERPLSEDAQQALRELLQLLLGQLEVLGFPVPADVGRPVGFDGMTQVLEGLRMRGVSQVRYVDPSALDEGPSLGASGAAAIERSYSLRLSGTVTDQINLGAALRGESRLKAVGASDFRLDFGGVDIGVSRSAVAHIGEVSGAGFNELVLGRGEPLLGVQAGVHTGQLDSKLLFGSFPPASGGPLPIESALEATVAAWDGSVQLSDRLRLGASVARLDREGESEDEGEKKLVFSLGGTYTVSPTLTLAGEMAQSATEDGGAGAFKVGAVIHPMPDLILGAHLFTTLDSGYHSIFSDYEDRVSRLDLSAEVGRWILSLRRQQILRSPEDVDGEMSGAGVTTEVDVSYSLEKGVLSLGYTLEDVGEAPGENSRPLRAATASLEHTVGPTGKALAGFSIVEQEKGSETTSNIGVRYDFDDASVTLKYEIFTKPGEVTGNVTTAEVSIQF